MPQRVAHFLLNIKMLILRSSHCDGHISCLSLRQTHVRNRPCSRSTTTDTCGHLIYENYREITADVLLMYGGKSNTTWVNMAMERLATVLLRSETKEFPKLDHFGIDKKAPREVAKAVSAYFLKD